VIGADGSQHWYLNGQLHRTDGPAWIGADGRQMWYLNDQRHRSDGPARIWADGSQEWWIRDQNITEEVEAWMQARDITWPLDHITQVEFALSWS
jgi:hypothetical protein